MCVFSVYPCNRGMHPRQTFPRTVETWKNVARIFRLSVFHKSHPLCSFLAFHPLPFPASRFFVLRALFLRCFLPQGLKSSVDGAAGGVESVQVSGVEGAEEGVSNDWRTFSKISAFIESCSEARNIVRVVLSEMRLIKTAIVLQFYVRGSFRYVCSIERTN